MIDTIKMDVPTFIRLLELAREEVTDDVSLHFISEIVAKISQSRIVDMDDYDKIVDYMKKHMKKSKKTKKSSKELDDIKRLGGLDR